MTSVTLPLSKQKAPEADRQLEPTTLTLPGFDLGTSIVRQTGDGRVDLLDLCSLVCPNRHTACQALNSLLLDNESIGIGDSSIGFDYSSITKVRWKGAKGSNDSSVAPLNVALSILLSLKTRGGAAFKASVATALSRSIQKKLGYVRFTRPHPFYTKLHKPCNLAHLHCDLHISHTYTYTYIYTKQIANKLAFGGKERACFFKWCCQRISAIQEQAATLVFLLDAVNGWTAVQRIAAWVRRSGGVGAPAHNFCSVLRFRSASSSWKFVKSKPFLPLAYGKGIKKGKDYQSTALTKAEESRPCQ